MALRRVAGRGRGFALLASPILILGLMGPRVSASGDIWLWLDKQSVRPGQQDWEGTPPLWSLRALPLLYHREAWQTGAGGEDPAGRGMSLSLK